MKSNYIIPIFQPHRGCRHRCIFCNEWEFTGVEKPVRPADVVDTINQYLATIPRSSDTWIEVGYYGGSFTCLPISTQEELLAPAYHVMQKGEIQGIRLSTRPDCINHTVTALLNQYGVNTVELGVQSLSDEVLTAAKRGHTASDVRTATTSLKSAGLRVGAQLMVGLPHDDKANALQTIRELITLNVDFVRIHPTVILRDTELERYYRNGTYQPLDMDTAIDICKSMLLFCEKSGVDVIRMGIHPSEGLLDGAVAAGPFHPSFGEMVYSALAFDLMNVSLSKTSNLPEEITFFVPKRKESIFRGQRNQNLHHLRALYPVRKILIKESESLPLNSLVLRTAQGEEMITLADLPNPSSETN